MELQIPKHSLYRPTSIWVTLTILLSCLYGCASGPNGAAGLWEPIFDGKTLEGWSPKIAGEITGKDKRDTFRVENNKIIVDYSNYQTFDNDFGHLFFNRKLSDFRISLEYRFTGDQVEGGPEWAFANSGLMLLAQSPDTMALEQGFPVSVEAQLLGAFEDVSDRTTSNVCTPGTHIVMNDKLVTDQCINSKTPASAIGEWVHFEADVKRNGDIRLFINDVLAFELSEPQFDIEDSDALALDQENTALREGFIALQAESHPVEFRNIRLLDRSRVRPK